MHNHEIKQQKMATRREFLSKAGIGGLLIGNAFNQGRGLAQEIQKPDADRYQSLYLTTHEWFGDFDERLDLSKDWEVNINHMPGNSLPVLTREQIRERIRNPIDSKMLRDIAAGKKTAVILFDDVTRPTPVKDVMPALIEELKAGGIKDEHILLVCGMGAHRGMTTQEARAKLGDDVVDSYPWINHNCHNNLVELGKTSFGNRIKIYHYVMKADVKVSISGIKVHSGPGYSGGAKAILPGCASVHTIEYNHTHLAGGTGKIYHNEIRQDMEEAARMAGLDFSVQVIINGKRQVTGIYAGDVVDAFRPAVHEANKRYGTELVQNSDVVIANPYPRNMQDEPGLDWCNSSLREGGTAIGMCQMPLGRYTLHYKNRLHDYTGASFWENPSRQFGHNLRDPVPKAGLIIIYSQYLQYRNMTQYPEGRIHLCRTWDEVLALVEKAHGPSTSVGVYPYVGIQHRPITIDGP